MRRTQKRFLATRLTLLITLALATGAATAQLTPELEAEIAKAKDKMLVDKRALIGANMQLSEVEAAAFWPVYDEYEAQLKLLADRRIEVIERYAEFHNSNSLTDDAAVRLLKDYLAIEKERVDIKEQFVERFSTAIQAKRAARFFQVDHRLETLVNLGLAQQIPLVK